MKTKLIVTAIFLTSIYISCSPEEELSYTADIEPLLTSCASPYCHGTANYAGTITNYQDFVDMVDRDRVLPALRHEEGYSAMPKADDKWPSEDISLLEDWISQGMPE